LSRRGTAGAFGCRHAAARYHPRVTPAPDDVSARPEPVDGELYGPVEVGPMLGVKPQVVVNWIRDDRIHPSAVDDLGRNRFTADDVRRIRASLGKGTPA
jgi:hypothetical protein